MWHRLLVLLGLARLKVPEPDTSDVIDLDTERLKRTPVVFVGYVTEKQCTTPRDA